MLKSDESDTSFGLSAACPYFSLNQPTFSVTFDGQYN